MKVKIRTLTPVHVGNGESYSYGDAYLDGNMLHRCEIDYSQNPSLVSEMIESIKREDMENVQRILRRYGRDIYAAKLRTNFRFESYTSIRDHIKMGKIPYFPGTTIKGSIRTSLYAYYLHSKNFEIDTPKGRKNFLNLLKFGDKELGIRPLGEDKNEDYKYLQRKNKKIFKNTYGKRFEQLVFFYLKCGRADKKDQCRWENAKYDIMKFVEVSDFIPMNYQIYVDRIRTYSKGARGTYPKRFSIFAETVEGEFEGSIMISPSLKHIVKDNQINKKKLEILGLQEEDVEDFDNMTQKFLKHLQKAAKYFYDIAVKYDREQLGFVHPPQVNSEDFKIRFGFGVGTHYQTILKLLENIDREIVKEIIEQNRLSKYRNLYPTVSYPKSYECIEHGRRRIPLGWVKVIA